ncbi:proline-rich spliceosome-associated family protein [Salix suchowensis]|nr:proline-rich spliceosome-associated family protein [Salix suchowensis]
MYTVISVWDATSADPKLLVFLKSYKNTVPVPRHWCQKRKFLQGSGCDNHGALTYQAAGGSCWPWVSMVLRSNLFTFQLPDFIAATGIEKIRQILLEDNVPLVIKEHPPLGLTVLPV